MTYDEWQPLARQLVQASLTAFPVSADPATGRTKAGAWCHALADLPIGHIAAAVDWLCAHATEPVSRPGMIRARVVALRSPPEAGPRTGVYVDGIRTFVCSRCLDHGVIDAVVTYDNREYECVTPCNCKIGYARRPQFARAKPANRVLHALGDLAMEQVEAWKNRQMESATPQTDAYSTGIPPPPPVAPAPCEEDWPF